jgi:hypothetical protein
MMKNVTITVDEDRAAQDALLEDYRRMAGDGMRENEANEWVEALVGDATRLDGCPKPKPLFR